MYLRAMQSIIIAYYEKNTSHTDRIYFAWLSVFICRFWSAWLHTQSKDDLEKQYTHSFSNLLARISPELNEAVKVPNATRMKFKQQFMITIPCHFSIEINAHSLTYLILRAIERQIPFEALSIDLFNSHSCESAFRSARAMSGVSSSIVNFTVFDFLRRADKISALQSIRTEHESTMHGPSLCFPKHHKHGKTTTNSTRDPMDDSLQYQDVERIVQNAFRAAHDLIKPMIDQRALKTNGYETIDGLSSFMRKRFHASKLIPKSSQETCEDESDVSKSDLEEDEEEEEEDGEGSDRNDDDVGGTDVNIDVEEEEDVESLEHLVLDSSDFSFKGMRVKESIESTKANSYFKVKRTRDAADVFIHKQTASWVSTTDKPSLSSDRLQRVAQERNQ